MAEACPGCGGSNPTGATQCAWCGSDLPLSTSTYPPPLIFNHPGASLPVEPEELPDAPASSDDDTSEERGTYWTGMRVVRLVLASVVLVVLVAALVYNASNSAGGSSGSPGGAGSSGGPVQVSVIQVNSPDDACGLAGAVAGEFVSPAFSFHPISWWLPLNGVQLPCTVSSVVSDTPGFSLTANVPLTVSSAETPLMITLYTPATYSGVLTLTIQ